MRAKHTTSPPPYQSGLKKQPQCTQESDHSQSTYSLPCLWLLHPEARVLKNLSLAGLAKLSRLTYFKGWFFLVVDSVLLLYNLTNLTQ